MLPIYIYIYIYASGCWKQVGMTFYNLSLKEILEMIYPIELEA